MQLIHAYYQARYTASSAHLIQSGAALAILLPSAFRSEIRLHCVTGLTTPATPLRLPQQAPYGTS